MSSRNATASRYTIGLPWTSKELTRKWFRQTYCNSNNPSRLHHAKLVKRSSTSDFQPYGCEHCEEVTAVDEVGPKGDDQIEKTFRNSTAMAPSKEFDRDYQRVLQTIGLLPDDLPSKQSRDALQWLPTELPGGDRIVHDPAPGPAHYVFPSAASNHVAPNNLTYAPGYPSTDAQTSSAPYRHDPPQAGSAMIADSYWSYHPDKPLPAVPVDQGSAYHHGTSPAHHGQPSAQYGTEDSFMTGLTFPDTASFGYSSQIRQGNIDRVLSVPATHTELYVIPESLVCGAGDRHQAVLDCVMGDDVYTCAYTECGAVLLRMTPTAHQAPSMSHSQGGMGGRTDQGEESSMGYYATG